MIGIAIVVSGSVGSGSLIGDIYAFAELNLEALEDTLATANDLSESFRRYFSENSNAGFDRFVEDGQQW